MINGFLDIPFAELEMYWNDAKKKRRVCEIVPQGRFNIYENGKILYNGMVCKDMGGESTGAGARYCTNCSLKKKPYRMKVKKKRGKR